MPNPNINPDMSSQSQQSGTFRDARDRFTREGREMRSRAQDVMSDASETASELYDQASQWMQENYGKTAAVFGLVAIAGITGYLLGRNARPESTEQNL